MKKIYAAGTVLTSVLLLVHSISFSQTTFFAGTGSGTGNTGSNTTGVGISVLHSSNSGSNNSGFGYRALYSNKDGYSNSTFGSRSGYSNITGDANTFIGFESGFSNSSGNDNTFLGYASGHNSTTGTSNTFVGWYSGYNNGAGYNNTYTGNTSCWQNNGGHDNAIFGYSAAYNNKSGNYNCIFGSAAAHNATSSQNSIFGYEAAYSNTSGYDNTVFGAYSAYANTSGYSNAVFGKSAGYNSTGSNNAFFGNYAGVSNITGSYNTYIGYNSRGSSSSYTNATAIGYNAIASASNQVMLGNSSVTSVKAAGSITIVSDMRFKKNVKNNVPGLVFINQLKPVTFNYDINKLNSFVSAGSNNFLSDDNLQNKDEKEQEAIAEKQKKVYTGFIAQDVEKLAEKLGFDFSGIYKPQNDKDPYGLSYEAFVVPLVKAVQELSLKNDIKDSLIENLQQQINQLKSMIVSENRADNTSSLALSDISLEQNIPNPFKNSTSIRYALPAHFSSAEIIIEDQNGKQLRRVNVNAGKGVLNVDATALSPGTYSYSLIVDGRLTASKKMVLIK